MGTERRRRWLQQRQARTRFEFLNPGNIAKRVGRPKVVRAVGAANGRNPIRIIIPCHRVIGNSADMTGLGGDIPTKEALLRLELEHSQFPHAGA